MALPPFRNFLAAGRKPNIHRFGFLPQTDTLDWIDSASWGVAPDEYVHPTTLLGTMDGANDTFTMANVSVQPSKVKVIWNGIVLQEDTGFTVSVATITMLAGYIPESGDTLSALAWP